MNPDGAVTRDGTYSLVINKSQQLQTLMELSDLTAHQVVSFCRQEPRVPIPAEIVDEISRLLPWEGEHTTRGQGPQLVYTVEGRSRSTGRRVETTHEDGKLISEVVYSCTSMLEEDNQMSGEDNRHGMCVCYVGGEIVIRTYSNDELDGLEILIGRDGEIEHTIDWRTVGPREDRSY